MAVNLYRFAIDRSNGRFLDGWCFHRLLRNRPVALTICADQQVLGTVSCSRFRRDLKEARLHPTGCCGFDFSMPRTFDPNRHQALYLYADSGRRPLATIPCAALDMLRPAVDKPIFFMHIPKTAGSSFNAFARQCFSGDEFLTHVERLPAQDRAHLVSQARYLSGHLPWREISTVVDPDEYDLYSIIRDPLAHLHSHLNYVRLVHTEAEHEVHYDYRHNETIRGLAGRIAGLDFYNPLVVERFVTELSGYECDFFDNIQTRYFLDHRPERVSETDFDMAARTIRRFKAIGLTEHYDRFRNRFCGQVGLPLRPQPIRSNESQRYRLLDRNRPDIAQLVEPLIRFDRLLYELVVQQDFVEPASGITTG